MKALLLIENLKFLLKEIETPVVKDSEELINVEVSGIGGSEYLGFKNSGIRPLPNIMGHGITGLTADNKRVAIYPVIGCESCDYCKSGKLQLCNNWKMIGVHFDGGFAQKVVVPKKSIFKIPDELTWEQSSFIEPFANSINAWNLANINQNHSILVIGAGSLGLGLFACAKDSNHKNITIAEHSISRKQAAKDLGAETVDNLHLNSYDIVFDTVGSTQSRNDSFRFVKKNGKCIYLGFAEPKLEVNFSELIRNQIQLVGSFAYSKSQFEKAIKLSLLTNSKWVKNITFLEVEKELNNYLKGDFSTIKAILRPN